jgi:PST family polysaccharide transporter
MPKTKNIWDVFYINDEFFIYPIIDKIKNKEEYKRLFSNFISLSVLQAANYLLPLITLPYLVRVLGPEKYGLVSFAQAFVTYFMILTDYGFNLSATREISINRDNKKKVSEIFSSVMTIKAGLLIVSFMLMSIIVFSFGKFSRDWPIYYLTFGMVLGQVLFPVWFFQGMERMKYITVLNVTAKLIFTVAIFVFVHHMEDFLYVPLLNTLGYIIAGILSLWLIFRDFNIRFNLPSLSDIKHHLKEGWYIFLSQIQISLFSNTNTVILGLFTNNVAVGYYTMAEKLMRALAMMQVPIVGSLFPHISELMIKNKNNVIKELKKIILYGSIIYIVILFLIFIFSKNIILILFGDKAKESILLFKIMCVIPLTIFLNNIFGTQILLNINKEKEFFKVLFVGGVLSVLLCILLSYFYGALGTAISMLIVEIYIMLGMFFYGREFLYAK